MTAHEPQGDDVWIVGEVEMSRAESRRVRPRGKTTSESAADRREFERALMDKVGTLVELDNFGIPGADWQCRIADISRGGMGLRSRRMVHENRVVLVLVEQGPGQPRKLLSGVVRQCRYAEGEGYVVGVQFQAPPQTTPVKAWLAEHGFGDLVAGPAMPD